MITLALLAIAIACAAALIHRQLGLPAPMLPVDLYRRPMFALSSLTSFCSFTAQGLAFVALPFYFQTVLGFNAVQTGLLLTPWLVMTAIAAPIAGPLSDRFPPAILGGTGLAILAAGLALVATLPGHPGVPGIVWRMLICGTGFGFFQSPNLRAIMSSAPAERSGGASGIVATSRLCGQAVGAALVALCFGMSMQHGPSLALALAAVFSGAGSVVSFSRLAARQPGPAPRQPPSLGDRPVAAERGGAWTSRSGLIRAAIGRYCGRARNKARSPKRILPMSEPLPTAKPDEVGLSQTGLDRLSAALDDRVASGHIPGAVALVARHGKVAYHQSFGRQDPASDKPMGTDAIFRIYSMTKAIVSVGVMMLWEEGRLLLGDPISKYIPGLRRHQGRRDCRRQLHADRRRRRRSPSRTCCGIPPA